jgi:hypothetical protein
MLMTTNLKVKSSLLLLTLMVSTGHAAVSLSTKSVQTNKFTNPDCALTDTCDLKSFEVKVTQYGVKIDNDPETLGTKMVANYQTTKSSSIEKYGIGQFIEGCQYVSKLENGVVVNYPVIKREFMGEMISYFHPEMVVDGFIPDPLAWGEDANASRHSTYITKEPSGDFTAKDYYNGLNLPRDNRLYVIDRPGVAGYYANSERAYNISLKFKTCIYKAADVPKDVHFTNTTFATPLHCVEWASSNVYNYEKGIFETLPEISPYCTDYGKTLTTK